VTPTRRTRVSVGKRTLVFPIPRVAPSANAVVARATRTFRALKSVRYVESLASGPKTGIVSVFTLERPDRLEYRIRGGTSGIVIGTRRWDRFGAHARWTRSQTTKLPQPAPIWSGPVTNAHVLARTRKTITVSFLNPNVPAWFEITFVRRTMRPRTLRMTAAAHFMAHRYVAFDEPPRIRPPTG
jgi:hypothetical protein